MPIIFISLNEKFIEYTKNAGYQSFLMKIEDYKPDPNKITYYVSPANSIGFMDGGIDMALSNLCFPGCERYVMNMVELNGKENLIGRMYLPIGSSMLYDHRPHFYDSGLHNKEDFDKRFLMICPTMLLPQKVNQTENAYYATMSVLYNILEVQGKNIDDVDIILTSFCCGCGQMNEEESFNQMMKGIKDYKTFEQYIDYQRSNFDNGLLFAEPNLEEQPKLYSYNRK